MIRALLAALVDLPVAQAFREAFAAQRRRDLFEIQCQTCGGLGAVADYENPLPSDWAPAGLDPANSMTYRSKMCPDCGGCGSTWLASRLGW